MDRSAELLERRIPDAVSTLDLPAPIAAEIDFLAGRHERWTGPCALGAGVRARALAASSEPSAACEILEGFDPADASTQDVVAAAWAVSRVGPGELAGRLLDRVESLEEDFVVEGVPLGPTSAVTGILRASVGDLEGAAAELRRAATIGDGRAPIWGALARVELARVLRCAAAVSADPAGGNTLGESTRALIAARTFFLAGGYRSLLDRADECARHDLRGVLRSDDGWVVGFGVQPEVRVRASKGLVAIQYLLANRHRPVSSVELVRVLDGGDVGEVVELASVERLVGLTDNNAGPTDLAPDLRSVFFDDAVRSRATKLLRRTISKIRESHVLLGDHLNNTIGTGYTCRYEPVGDVGVIWEL